MSMQSGTRGDSQQTPPVLSATTFFTHLISHLIPIAFCCLSQCFCVSRHLISATVYDWTAQQTMQWRRRKESFLESADWWRPGGGRPRPDSSQLITTPQHARTPTPRTPSFQGSASPSPLTGTATAGRGKNAIVPQPSPVECVAHPVLAMAQHEASSSSARAGSGTCRPTPSSSVRPRRINWLATPRSGRTTKSTAMPVAASTASTAASVPVLPISAATHQKASDGTLETDRTCVDAMSTDRSASSAATGAEAAPATPVPEPLRPQRVGLCSPLVTTESVSASSSQQPLQSILHSPEEQTTVSRRRLPSREMMGAAGDVAEGSSSTSTDGAARQRLDRSVTEQAIGWMRTVNDGVLKLPEMP